MGFPARSLLSHSENPGFFSRIRPFLREFWECSEKREGIAQTGGRKFRLFSGAAPWPGGGGAGAAAALPEAAPGVFYGILSQLFPLRFQGFFGITPRDPAPAFPEEFWDLGQEFGNPKSPRWDPSGSSQLSRECGNLEFPWNSGWDQPLMDDEPFTDKIPWNSCFFLGFFGNFPLPAHGIH